MQDKIPHLCEILKSQRKLLKISQQNMASVLNIDQSVYSRIEKEPEKMRIETLIRICEILDLDLSIKIKPLF